MGVPRLVLAALTTMSAACGGTPATAPAPQPTPETETALPAAAEGRPVDAPMLERPFTAEQIRDEWVEGFRVVMRRSTPDAARLERWTVVGADRDRATIEFATIADDGTVIGEPVVQESTWEELRDHAAFPAADASREWVTRDTALGAFDGWLYRVRDEEPGSVTEFFFVPEMPGAPIEMRVLEDGLPVLTMEMLERSRPAAE